MCARPKEATRVLEGLADAEKTGLGLLMLYIEAHALYLTRTVTTHTRRTIIAHFFSFFNPTNLLTVQRILY